MPEQQPRRITRRAAIGGTAALAAVAALWAARRPDRGGPHAAYFRQLSQALASAGIGRPVMVIDRSRLRANVSAVQSTLAGTHLAVRVVVKSLPSLGLLAAVADGLGSNRFMAFNGPMLIDMLKWRPDADLLLGKPLAGAEVAGVCDVALPLLAGRPGPQWLADSVERLRHYDAIGRARGARLRTSLEIDVGLHRGGFSDPQAVRAALDLIAASPALELAGLMGYDPHVPKMPSPGSAYRGVLSAYRAAVEVLRERHGGAALGGLTFNTAGSPTYRMHVDDPLATEVAIGSAFVKPKDFDLDTLSHHVPAAFIATPVLKVLDPLAIPGLERLAPAFRFLDANSARAFFVHGGHWLAEPESPPGLEYNSIYGRSSNQELLTGSVSVPLQPDDFVFLRPTQAEAILLQFGDLLVYDDGRISERWPTFAVSA
jgi:D-serine deaminase-like pyridoxal phosphate-dependent protein